MFPHRQVRTPERPQKPGSFQEEEMQYSTHTHRHLSLVTYLWLTLSIDFKCGAGERALNLAIRRLRFLVIREQAICVSEPVLPLKGRIRSCLSSSDSD